MRKSLILATAILSGLGIGAIITILLADRSGAFCPVCGGKLGTDKGSIVCLSCGVRLRVEEP